MDLCGVEYDSPQRQLMYARALATVWGPLGQEGKVSVCYVIFNNGNNYNDNSNNSNSNNIVNMIRMLDMINIIICMMCVWTFGARREG
jgi:hypothetical protein